MFKEDTIQSSAAINAHLQVSMTDSNHQDHARWPLRTTSKSQASIAFLPPTQTSSCSATSLSGPRPSTTVAHSTVKDSVDHKHSSSSRQSSSTPSSTTTSISDSSRKHHQPAEPSSPLSSWINDPSYASPRPRTPNKPPRLTSDLKYLHSRARRLNTLLTYQGSLIAACRTFLTAQEGSRSGFYTQGDCTALSLPGPLMPSAPTSSSASASARKTSWRKRPRAQTASRHVHWADEEERSGIGEVLGLGISNVSLGEADRLVLEDKRSTRLGLRKVSKDKRLEKMDGAMLEEKVTNGLKKLMFGYQEIALQLAVVEVEIELVVLRWWSDAWVEDF